MFGTKIVDKPEISFGAQVWCASLGLRILLPERHRPDEKTDFTTMGVLLYGCVFYVHAHFTLSRKDGWVGIPEFRISAQVYYGLGSDSGPASTIKRHRYVPIFKKAVK